MDSTLLKTKLYRPLVRPELVPRPYLTRRLNEGLNGKLTVVSAPAGYGKTTLVSAWASECSRPIAWLSLDEEDNEPARFLTYFITAVQGIKPGLGQEILNALLSAQPPPIANILPILINQLDDIQEPYILVLDDYHIITVSEIHKAITFIVNHQPPRMHLLLTTRIDPPLPLAQLRGRGQLTELRQADLRFSEDETAAFLKRGSGIELPPEEINLLLNRTEGWIAGLQMAALSMRNKKDIPGFIEGFSGSHEYIVDYFSSEILNNLPETTRSFLLKTSFLDQLCGPLCDAVTGQSSNRQILEELQDANLFLIPLDDEHRWYRYHQLFGDLLQKNLYQSDPSGIAELHLRASQWFEKNGYPHQAIEQAYMAYDFSRVADLLEDVIYSALGRGEHNWILKMVEKLPEGQIATHLRLYIIKAAIYISSGYLPKAEDTLHKIEDYLASQTLAPMVQEYSVGRVAALRGMIAIQRGDVVNAKNHAQLALAELAKGTQPEAAWRADALITLGLANFADGDLADARQNLAMALEDAILAGNPYTYLEVTIYLVEILWSQGRLKEAMDVCQIGLQFIEKNNLGSAPMSGVIFTGYGFLLCECFDLGQAEGYLSRGSELIRLGGVRWASAWDRYVKMRYLIAGGDLQAAEAFGQEIDQLTAISDLPSWVGSGIAALTVLNWVRLGKLDKAERYLKKRGIWIDSKIRYSYSREYLSLAALFMAKKDYVNAQALLDDIIVWADATRQYRALICAWTLSSMAFAAQHEMRKALESLAHAIELAEPEGYLLTILELGDSIAPLLYEAHQKGIHVAYTDRLLDQLKQYRPAPSARPAGEKTPAEFLTPLRPREIEVLKLAADGGTNKEIAVKLHISLRTVKFHMTCIFTKLGVDSRLNAVAKAQKLGILL